MGNLGMSLENHQGEPEIKVSWKIQPYEEVYPTKSNLLDAIKKAKALFVWVNFTLHDGAYVRVTKKAVMEAIQGWEETSEYQYNVRGQDGYLYIN